MEKYYTVADLTQMLNVCEKTIFRMIKHKDRSKQLPAVKVAGKWLIKESDLRDYLNRRANERYIADE